MPRSNAPYVQWEPIPQPVIILVRPQMGENIGMCARAMLNCGLTELRLVAPRDGWPNPAAIGASSGADLIMNNVKVYDSLEEAGADLNHMIGTTNRLRGMVKPIYTAEAAMKHCHTETKSGVRMGIVFGPERTGLENTDLAICGSVLSVPLNPDFNSLNLAQAVLLVSYEWAKIARMAEAEDLQEIPGYSEWAKGEELTFFLKRLEQILDKEGFFRTEELKPGVLLNLHTMFTRQKWTSQELQTLHGILTSLTTDFTAK